MLNTMRHGTEFQSTSPGWRTTKSSDKAQDVEHISIHVPRVEDDATTKTESRTPAHFNPRPPGGGRPTVYDGAGVVWRDFNPRPPGGGRLPLRREVSQIKGISIHVPRVEDDIRKTYQNAYGNDISIHVPRVEDDHPPNIRRRRKCRFQSTSPGWRTTLWRRRNNL